MKCLLCPTEIDDKKEFIPELGPQGQVIEDVLGKWKHAQELSRWVHVSLTAQRPAGAAAILSGHVCPKHAVEPGTVALAEVAAIAPAKSQVQDTSRSKGRE